MANNDDSRKKSLISSDSWRKTNTILSRLCFNDQHNTLETYMFRFSLDSVSSFIAVRWGCDVNALPKDLIWFIEFDTADSFYTWKKWLFSGSDEIPEHLADKIIANYFETVRNNFFV